VELRPRILGICGVCCGIEKPGFMDYVRRVTDFNFARNDEFYLPIAYLSGRIDSVE